MGITLVRIARYIHVVSAFWALLLGVIIVVDVVGRAFFQSPLPGTKEVVQNSIVAITFLQLPLAIFTGSMLRTPMIIDALGGIPQKVLRTLTLLFGAAFFLGVAYSSWTPAFDALAIGEYEGEGALRVPTYPVRLLLVATSAFAAIAYLMMIVYDWRGDLDEDESVRADLLK